MATYEDIEIDRGADASIEIHLVNKDGSIKNLAGHSFAAKMKKTYNSSDSDTTTFTASIVNSSNGIAKLSLTNTQTDALKPGRYVYDVEMSHDSGGSTLIERVLEGIITVTPSVTR